MERACLSGFDLQTVNRPDTQPWLAKLHAVNTGYNMCEGELALLVRRRAGDFAISVEQDYRDTAGRPLFNSDFALDCSGHLILGQTSN